MKRSGPAFLALAVGSVAGLALAASAAGTISAHALEVRHVQSRIVALALDGGRVAYDVAGRGTVGNKVLVWDMRTGKTTKVSGGKTSGADGVGGAGVFQLAVAGSRVAWLVNEGGNLEGDDYLFTSSLANPKEHKVASAMRSGENCPGREAPHCAGPWLGGLVGSGNLVALNRWTTDSQGAVASGGLYVLSGSRLKSVASGAGTVEAAAADGGRVAVLRTDGTVVLYSSSGKQLRTVSPASAKEIALSGHNLVVLSKTRTLALYDTRTGSLVRTLSLPPHTKRAPANLDLQGKIAIYTVGPLHGVNLSSGKDRVLADPRGGVDLARIDDAGVAYAGNGRGASYDKGTLVFVPLAGVVAKGSG